MNSLYVEIEWNGKLVPVGTIDWNDPEEAAFRYSREYLQSAYAAPISVSMPLREEAYSPKATKCFFEGLLPEGFTRRSVAQWMHVSENNYLSILSGLGQECLGAIRVLDPHRLVATPAYDPLTNAQVAALAGEGATKSTELVTKAHLSLTGASGKVGLYQDRDSGDWYLPIGEAPSTHIVKQSHVRLEGIVTNEQLCLLTARELGMDVPRSFIINTGEATDGEILLATERYDRFFPEHSDERIGHLRRPRRLHQEDFAQALGIPSSKKYEAPHGDYMKLGFELLRTRSADPVSDQLKLWDIIVMDYLVGNTDNHIKNLSILYNDQLKGIRLAPAYDIVATAIYESSTRDMGMSIGGSLSLDEINRDSFVRQAERLGLSPKLAMNRFDRLVKNFERALNKACDELTAKGFPNAGELRGRILATGGYRILKDQQQ